MSLTKEKEIKSGNRTRSKIKNTPKSTFNWIRKPDLYVVFWAALSAGLALINSLMIQNTLMGYVATAILLTTQVITVHKNIEEAPILLDLTIIGITAGFLEIFADFFLISIGSLNYPTVGPFILESPLYMPFAWNFIIVQLGYMSYRLYNEIGEIGPIITGITAASYVGVLEILAKNGELWWYEKTGLMFVKHSPLYIMLGEAIMFASIIVLIKNKPTTKENTVKKLIMDNIARGFLFSIIILVSYVTSYYFLNGISIMI